jgi:hypothetical protein
MEALNDASNKVDLENNVICRQENAGNNVIKQLIDISKMCQI